MAGFTYYKNVYGESEAQLETCLIAASVTMHKGGLARILTSGNPTAGSDQTGGGVVIEDVAATEAIYGLCEGFVTKDGIPLENADASLFDGTFTDGVYGVQSYASASDNLTDKKVCALIRPLRPGDIIAGTPDATPGTTAGSTTRFNYTDTVDDVTVDENNAGNSLATVAQLTIFGAHPTDSSKVLYLAKELQMENG